MCLVSSSVYTDAREGAIRAAADLYGSWSNEVIQTANAWYAVGVGYNEYTTGSALCGSISSSFIPNVWKNPSAINLGQTCAVSFSSTGFGGNYVASGTSVTMYPGFTASPSYTAYIDACAVAAYAAPTSEHSVAQSLVTDNKKSDAANTKNTIVPGISIYPNPATQYIVIKTTKPLQQSKCYMTDASGKRFACALTGTNTVNVSRLTPGLYCFHTIENEQEVRIKFIKQ